MDFLDVLRDRLTALLTERSAAHSRMEEILQTAAAEQRSDLNDAENGEWTVLRTRMAEIDGTSAELRERISGIEEARAAQIATADVLATIAARSTPAPAGSAARVTNEPATYNRAAEHGFFHDLISRSVDPSAAERLARNQREMESRAGTTANVAGLIPPQYLVDLFAPIMRSGRITSSIVGRRPLPPTGTSFNIGRATTGTLVGVQATENATLANADFDDTLLTFNLTTLGGYTEPSRQEIERSVGADMQIMSDLASIYANVLNAQVLNGSGAAGQLKGILNATGINAVTYTDATPTVPEIYSKIADAVQQINTVRQLPANAIVMHPRRWGWFTAALDTANRPLVAVNGSPYNPAGIGDAVGGVSPSPVGTIMGLPVFTDPGVPVNLGAGTNEDRIIVGRFEDAILMEEEGVVPYRVYEEPGSAALTLRIVVAGYAAFTAERYAAAFSVISGTGLVTPTF